MDFTLTTYRRLLTALQQQGFVFQTFAEFMERPTQPLAPEGVGLPLGNKRARAGKDKQKTIILRHDVDLLPQNSLQFAQIQNELGIKSSYFFRIVPESFHPEIIKKIAGLGHEIGYHYECLTTTNGDTQAGIADFEKKPGCTSQTCSRKNHLHAWQSTQ